jgi:hypothetical protein
VLPFIFEFKYGWEKRRFSIKRGIFEWGNWKTQTKKSHNILTGLIDIGFRGGPILCSECKMTNDGKRGGHHDA